MDEKGITTTLVVLIVVVIGASGIAIPVIVDTIDVGPDHPLYPLEAADFDAALVYCRLESMGHVFDTVYLPDVEGDHLASAQVPYGNVEDWLLLDATSQPTNFGEAWALDDPGFALEEFVDVQIAKEPSLEVVDTYWTIGDERISEAKMGDTIGASISIMACNGDIASPLNMHVRKNFPLWFDEDFKIESRLISLKRGGIQTLEVGFEPDEASSSSLRGYYVEVRENDEWIWSGPTLAVEKWLTALTLDALPETAVEGDTVTFTGRLINIETGAGVSGATIRIYEYDGRLAITPSDLITTGATDDEGYFSIPWTAEIFGPFYDDVSDYDLEFEIYAKFEGTSQFMGVQTDVCSLAVT